jgi:hypothetical protein
MNVALCLSMKVESVMKRSITVRSDVRWATMASLAANRVAPRSMFQSRTASSSNVTTRVLSS